MPSEVERRRKSTKPATTPDVADLPSLSVSDIADEGATALVARGAAYAREYAKIAHAPETYLRNIAVVMVALRRKHDDMRGRSRAYREDAAQIYRAADIAPNTRVTTASDTRARMQQSVRWHIGNILREELTADELRDLELHTASPLERQRDARAITSALSTAEKVVRQAATVEKATKPTKRNEAADAPADVLPEIPVKATADHLRLAHAARNIVAQLSPEVITNGMTDGQRAKLHDELGALQEAIRVLRRHTGKRRSGA